VVWLMFVADFAAMGSFSCLIIGHGSSPVRVGDRHIERFEELGARGRHDPA
jgi:hypothetical protein